MIALTPTIVSVRRELIALCLFNRDQGEKAFIHLETEMSWKRKKMIFWTVIWEIRCHLSFWGRRDNFDWREVTPLFNGPEELFFLLSCIIHRTNQRTHKYLGFFPYRWDQSFQYFLVLRDSTIKKFKKTVILKKKTGHLCPHLDAYLSFSKKNLFCYNFKCTE